MLLLGVDGCIECEHGYEGTSTEGWGEVEYWRRSRTQGFPTATAITSSSPAGIPFIITVPREIDISKCSSFLNMDSPATSSFPRLRNSAFPLAIPFATFPKNTASSSGSSGSTSASKSASQKLNASHTRGTSSPMCNIPPVPLLWTPTSPPSPSYMRQEECG
ncbi:hypothetical protein BJ165DRAFT_1529772 [Panaeolus papilionaceus]|nr:hypothetical protein BJ165DRAFT_1529772 [Panaeolus papilionaceus]